VSAAARSHIARQGFDPVYGARPLRRYIQRSLETHIGRALIGGGVADGGTISVDLVHGELSVIFRDGREERGDGDAVDGLAAVPA